MSHGSISAGEVLPVLPPARDLGRSRSRREALVGTIRAVDFHRRLHLAGRRLVNSGVRAVVS